MTCRHVLPAPGCIAAHDALVGSFVTWRIRQDACEAMVMIPDAAASADEAWGELKRHAANCGYDRAGHGDLIPWTCRRITAWGRSLGVDPAVIAVALGTVGDVS